MRHRASLPLPAADGPLLEQAVGWLISAGHIKVDQCACTQNERAQVDEYEIGYQCH